MALQYGPNPRPHNYNSSDSESEAEQRPTSEQCQKYFNKACAVGDLDAVKRYLSHGASVHGMRGCFTPLYHALSGEFGAKPPSLEVARYLIERGADVNNLHGYPCPGTGILKLGWMRPRAGCWLNSARLDPWRWLNSYWPTAPRRTQVL